MTRMKSAVDRENYLTTQSFLPPKGWLSSHGYTEVIASQNLKSILVNSFLKDLLSTLQQIYGQLPHNCLSTASLRIQMGRRNFPFTAQWHSI